MKRLVYTSLVLVMVITSFQYVWAEESVNKRTGLYVGVSGGVNDREDADDELAEARFDPGWFFSVNAGYRFENVEVPVIRDMRLELEYARQYNDIDTLYLHPTPEIDQVEEAEGRIDIESVHLVFGYDIPLFKKGKNLLSNIKPYVGLGLGFGRSILKGLGSPTLNEYAGMGRYPWSYTTGWQFSYSLRAGIGYEINRHFDVYVGGRYYKGDDVVVETPSNTSTTDLNQTTHPSVETCMYEIGLRYNF